MFIHLQKYIDMSVPCMYRVRTIALSIAHLDDETGYRNRSRGTANNLGATTGGDAHGRVHGATDRKSVV